MSIAENIMALRPEADSGYHKFFYYYEAYSVVRMSLLNGYKDFVLGMRTRLNWWSQRESNPCLRRERPAS